MSNEVDLGNEPVKHLLFILAVPAIVSQLVNALYNMVDRMYIGHIADIGATALTGVGVCFPDNNDSLSFCISCRHGGST